MMFIRSFWEHKNKLYEKTQNPIDFYFAYFLCYHYLKISGEKVEDQNIERKLILLKKYAYKSLKKCMIGKDSEEKSKIYLNYKNKIMKKLQPFINEDIMTISKLLYKKMDIEYIPKIKNYPHNVFMVNWGDYYGY